jgi:hypothetical protein
MNSGKSVSAVMAVSMPLRQRSGQRPLSGTLLDVSNGKMLITATGYEVFAAAGKPRTPTPWRAVQRAV